MYYYSLLSSELVQLLYPTTCYCHWDSAVARLSGRRVPDSCKMWFWKWTVCGEVINCAAVCGWKINCARAVKFGSISCILPSRPQGPALLGLPSTSTSVNSHCLLNICFARHTPGRQSTSTSVKIPIVQPGRHLVWIDGRGPRAKLPDNCHLQVSLGVNPGKLLLNLLIDIALLCHVQH